MSAFQPSHQSVCPCVRCAPGVSLGAFEFDLGDANSSSSGTSENGWPANADPSAIDIITIAIPLSGKTLKTRVTRKAAIPLMTMVQWWDAHVEPVKTLGGYSYRDIRGSTTTISNHGSGTAIDINGSQHKLGAEAGADGIPSGVRDAITAKAAELGIRWGGNYRHRKDAMHVEIAPTGYKAVAADAIQQAAGRVADTATSPWPYVLGAAIVGGLWYRNRSK